ncbi:MAG: GNAT family N-acetyltransferase [Oscillochloris sp.]|nr:GNAT family N-acetyltransferase [Oscillochloris sp.]
MLVRAYRIRPATAADQRAIRKLVRSAGINPIGLHWPPFKVAVSNDTIIGTVQVKPHRDGTRELASLAVVPQFQNSGIGAALIQTVQAESQPPLYLTCVDRLEGFYNRFHFRRVEPRALPPHLGRTYMFANFLFGLTRQPFRLLVMRWGDRQ